VSQNVDTSAQQATFRTTCVANTNDPVEHHLRGLRRYALLLQRRLMRPPKPPCKTNERTGANQSPRPTAVPTCHAFQATTRGDT
jgi:hypothetical protein